MIRSKQHLAALLVLCAGVSAHAQVPLLRWGGDLFAPVLSMSEARAFLDHIATELPKVVLLT